MRKLLFLIVTTAILCSCDKINIDNQKPEPETPKNPVNPEPEMPIKAEDIPNSYWFEHSYYLEYTNEEGEKVYEDSNDYEEMMGGSQPRWWYFKDNAELIIYWQDEIVPMNYYMVRTYMLDIEAKVFMLESAEYKIIKFTDKELIVESMGRYGDIPALRGSRLKRTYPRNGAFNNYIPYEEMTTN